MSIWWHRFASRKCIWALVKVSAALKALHEATGANCLSPWIFLLIETVETQRHVENNRKRVHQAVVKNGARGLPEINLQDPVDLPVGETHAFTQPHQSNRSNQTRGSGQWTTVKVGVVLFIHQRVTPTKQIIGWRAGSVFRSSAYTLFRRAMAQHIHFHTSPLARNF